jgi:tRNA pseudouridine55 synthase
MNGILVIDKPQGLTSHDVVAVARRAFGGLKIGHTGTLDPLATGVLPLAIGRATRLARFFSASEKDYDATIRFGLTTDTYDITGRETSRTNATPSRDEVIRALRALTGESLQTPPAYSAKKIAGRRAYDLARREHAVELRPAPVRMTRADLAAFDGGAARVVLTCSAGFYVRSLAHTLGQLTGTGACLEALRRTRSGEFDLDSAVPIDDLRDPSSVVSRVIPPSAVLQHLPAVTLNERGTERASHGRELESNDYGPVEPWLALFSLSSSARSPDMWVRLLDRRGGLIGLGTSGNRPGSLHPALVLM